MIHTGDIKHLSKVEEFDNANHAISEAGLVVHYVPGEHDRIDEEMKLYRERLTYHLTIEEIRLGDRP